VVVESVVLPQTEAKFFKADKTTSELLEAEEGATGGATKAVAVEVGVAVEAGASVS
jgi:hypothetical protein